MAQELAAVYAHIYGLCLDVSLLEYVDPRGVDRERYRKTLINIRSIKDILHPALVKQNDRDASGLSLELEHLISNLSERMAAVLEAMEDNAGPEKYFERLHFQRRCMPRKRVEFTFYGACAVQVDLLLLNDIELFFKRFNSVFYCISSEKGLEGLGRVIEFLKELRGISPVPSPDAYLSSLPCIKCLDEVTILPNQGDSISALLSQVSCNHVCRPLNGEPVQDLFQNELMHLGVDAANARPNAPKRDNSSIEASKSSELLEASLASLQKYNIFKQATESVSELSNLIYWNTHRAAAKSENGAQCSKLLELMAHEENMNSLRTGPDIMRCMGDPAAPPIHFFDLRRPRGIEALFCSGIFNSVDDVIDALKKDCSTAFAAQPKFQNVLKRQNELYVRLNNALKDQEQSKGAPDRATSGAADSEAGERAPSALRPVGNPSRDNVISDASYRKNAYFKKLTKDGMEKLYACLENQGAVLKDTLVLRVWGDVLYEEATRLKNHFMRRRDLCRGAWTDMTLENSESFENSKHIKSILYNHSLSREHLDSLTMTFYKLISGPLVPDDCFFPLPHNMALSFCLDAAGAMPHHKMLVSEIIWPTIEPKDWIDTNFNQFFTIRSGDLNNVQREAWMYIREVVLSVSLYNRAWEKNLCIRTPFAGDPGTGDEMADIKREPLNGLYLTYDAKTPLILIEGEKGWIFKDLYSLLYVHLQLTSHSFSLP
ncbi:DNA packaging terminase subunit 2 [Common bottlenose dolphin gammaherpesvirus 1 strain Sarasota]|uniref:DNA packaging terminase subunit 2 n=1 Tax=Common bottlenose dolphin gammaherpesvirus 1 strain Sarasota TaxID=2022783 RepID=A0A1Z1NEE8_9GAMA|nr:DNA packaging terminase subunit 2 [Common bottlenose dolphin gammaherpesvirus 1 strain Sarasota]ARW78074.1 DNA packaging terminase subunit 2 [Common bottlenose dolphin gammaherpesvirus 1 strain Sarasota]